MITYAQFIIDFAEFANTARYPQSSFNYYLQFAGLMITPPWGPPAASGQPYTLNDIGTELFIAHHLAIEAKNALEAAAGGIPGTARGVISAEGVDGESVSYDTASSSELDAGHWNLTTYGTRFVQLARTLGSAPIQISPAGIGPAYSGPGWFGPTPWPGYFSS